MASAGSAKMDAQSDNTEFRLIWAEAQNEYIRLTGHSFGEIVQPDSVAALEKTLTDDHSIFVQTRGTGKSKILFFAHNALVPLQAVSRIIAEGASEAFPPAKALYGAANYLVNAAHGVSEAYDAIEILFERLEAFTVRLEHYTRIPKVDPHLRTLLAKILKSMLVLIALQTKITTDMTKHRVKEYIRQLAQTEQSNAVFKELENLERLMAEESHLVLVLLQEMTSIEAAKNEVFRSDLTDSQAAQLRKLQELTSGIAGTKEDLNYRFRKTLNPDMSAIEDSLVDARRPILPGTCMWIHKKALFQSWSKSPAPQMLRILGRDGSGKTMLAVNIVDELIRRYPQGDVQGTSSVSVSYCFYEAGMTLARIIKTMAYFAVLNDKIYAKHIEGSIAELEDNTSVRKLWKLLFLQPFERCDVKNSAILVFDGLDEAEPALLRQLNTIIEQFMERCEEGHGPRMKILLLAKPDGGLSDIIEDEDRLTNDIPTIEILPEDNEADIDAFIEFKLRNARSLDVEKKEIITHKLRENADGMFKYVSLTTQEILRKRMPAEMVAAADNLPKDLNEALYQMLQRLSDTSDEDMITDLNILLEWTACSNTPMTLKLLGEIIEFQRRCGPYELLEHDLRKRYASLFVLTRTDRLTSEDILGDDMMDDSEDEDDPASDLPHIQEAYKSDSASTTVKLNHSIHEFFRRRGKAGTKIGVDFKSANNEIAKQCMILLCEDYDSYKDTSLCEYARYWICHLHEGNTNLFSVEEKAKVAGWTAQLLQDSNIIRRWRNSKTTEPIASLLFVSNLYVEAIKDLFISMGEDWYSTNDTDLPWSTMLASSTAAFKASFLKSIAWNIAEAWLKSAEVSVAILFQALHIYIKAVDGASPSQMHKVWSADKFTTDQILKTARWAGFEEDLQWKWRVAMVLGHYKEYEESAKYFHDSLKIDPGNWNALLGLSMVLGNQAKCCEAIDTMERAFLSMPLNEIRSSMLFDLARWYEKLGNFDKAIATWKRALRLLESQFSVFSAFYSLLYMYANQKQYKEACDLAEELNHLTISSNNSLLVDQILLAYNTVATWEDNLVVMLLQIPFFHEQKIPWLLEIQKSVFQVAKRKRESGMLVGLRHSLAMLYYWYLNEPEKAVRLWQRAIHNPAVSSTTSRWFDSKKNATDNLAHHYMNEAMKARKNGTSPAAAIKALESLGDILVENATDVPEEVPGGSTRPSERYKESVNANDSRTHISSLLLGCWYHFIGDQEHSRIMLREHILVAIELLSDDTDDNDGQGFYQLGKALLKYGDTDDAMQAFSILAQMCVSVNNSSIANQIHAEGEASNKMITQQPSANNGAETVSETDKKDSERDGDNEVMYDSDADQTMYLNGASCDGSGFGSCPFVADLRYDENHNICVYCADIDFCNDCVRRLRAGKLPAGICHPSHELVNMGRCDKTLPKGHVRYGGDGGTIPWQKWVREVLKGKWVVL